MEKSNKFHEHLDVCRRCRDHPFDLCSEGESLLREAVKKIEDNSPLSMLFKRPTPPKPPQTGVEKMLTGKYWILPDGAVIDTSTTEHAVLAREKILRLDRDDPLRVKSPFYKLTAQEAKRLFDRDPESKFWQYKHAIEYMLAGGDPRWWVIEKYDWIRVAKSGMWVWRFDTTVLRRIRKAAEYWKAQKTISKHDVVGIVEIDTRSTFEIPVEKLRRLKETADALRRYKCVASDLVV